MHWHHYHRISNHYAQIGMAEELPQNLEMYVLHMIKGAFKSREVLEAEWPDHAPLDDGRVMLQNWMSLVHRQGSLLALLSVTPSREPSLRRGCRKWSTARRPGWTPTFRAEQ